MPSETVQIILGIVLLIAVYLLTRIGILWRIRRAGAYIVRDLERQNAVDAASAVDLPYVKRQLIRIGMRDFRPKALESLLQGDIVARTEEGRYFLKTREHPFRTSG